MQAMMGLCCIMHHTVGAAKLACECEIARDDPAPALRSLCPACSTWMYTVVSSKYKKHGHGGDAKPKAA